MFGRQERIALLMAYQRPGEWVLVRHEDKKSQKSLQRAVYRLEAVGLIERASFGAPLVWPRVRRMHIRLTHTGRHFADLFRTQLHTGGRIALRKFTQSTGISIPRKQKQIPGWIKPGNSCHRASSQAPPTVVQRTGQ